MTIKTNRKPRIDLRNWFTLPYDEQRELRPAIVPVDRPLEAGEELCDICDGFGRCGDCHGSGEVEHDCHCDYCTAGHEPCGRCDSSGKCDECDGKGVVAGR